MNKDKLKRTIEVGLKPFIIPSFWISRWIHHNHFLLWLNNRKVGKPSYVSLPFVGGYLFIRESKKAWNRAFANYALPKYKEFTKIHYSKNGWGYFSLENFTPEEQLDYYNSRTHRLSSYLDNNSTLLNCKDSDSFLDAGCGAGGNIRELSKRFPNSEIKGFDINPEAINIIKTCEKNPNVKVETANFLNEHYLSNYPENSYDWVIYSFALGFIAETSVDETNKKRKKIIEQLNRIAKKGFIMLEDSPDLEFKVLIEQNNRCSIKCDYTEYFRDLPGEFYMMSYSESDWAYCILKDGAQ